MLLEIQQLRCAPQPLRALGEQEVVDTGLWMTAMNNFEVNADVYPIEQCVVFMPERPRHVYIESVEI